ncbi:GTP pyrophosphokinase family protein [Pseudoalteromonas sp. Ld20]|uniref:GTP pyrophosphokinase n=1 Tax=Pseudoalteromonas sp. Ld20 TaxID=649165 RepID=UPI0038631DA0
MLDAYKVESLLSEVFEMEGLSYHIITSRAKTIESVKGKVSKDKYDKPKEQIQDFSGIRIITYVEDEITKICEVIEKSFQIDLANSSNKSDDLGIDKVGYKSVHYIASLDKSRLKLPEYKQYEGKCFEIQIRTILQHAWAEIEHDKNYKFTGKLPPDIGRRFKILSGVLEMADREFNNISNEIDLISKGTLESTQKGDFNIPISSTTLTQFLSTKFPSIEKSGYKLIPDTDGIVIGEMERFGLNTLEDFNNIIPNDFDETFISAIDEDVYEFGLVRRLLIINDHHKYFTQANTQKFDVWSPTANDQKEYGFFKHYGIDWDDIEQNFNVKICDDES